MSAHWVRNDNISLSSYNASTLTHQTLNWYLLLKSRIYFLLFVAKASLLRFQSGAQFPRELGEVPPTQILFYLRQTEKHFHSTSHEKSPIQAAVFETQWVCTWLNANAAASLATNTGRGTRGYCSSGKIIHLQINVWAQACPMPSSRISMTPPSCQANGMVLLFTGRVETGPLQEKKCKDAAGKWE